MWHAHWQAQPRPVPPRLIAHPVLQSQVPVQYFLISSNAKATPQIQENLAPTAHCHTPGDVPKWAAGVDRRSRSQIFQNLNYRRRHLHPVCRSPPHHRMIALGQSKVSFTHWRLRRRERPPGRLHLGAVMCMKIIVPSNVFACGSHSSTQPDPPHLWTHSARQCRAIVPSNDIAKREPVGFPDEPQGTRRKRKHQFLCHQSILCITIS